jgi:hypothetical protein
MKLYKLTDEDGRTYGGMQWGENVTHDESELLEGDGPLCSGHWYHAYIDPLLAVMLNCAHANFKHPRLWVAEGEPKKIAPDKVGCKRVTTLHEIQLPEVTHEQHTAFAIMAAKAVYPDDDFVAWANSWLGGTDRSAEAAAAAADAADAAYAAYAAAADAAFAAYVADAAFAAADAAATYVAYGVRKQTFARCADLVREVYPQPPKRWDAA